jgi:GxxExxY protein
VLPPRLAFRLIPTNNPLVRGGVFHHRGRPFSCSGGGGDIVKRFKMSDAAARDSSIPHRVIKVDRPPVSVNMPNEPDFRSWSIEWSTLLEVAGETYFDLGDGLSEKAYQTSLLHRLYQRNVPVLMERDVYVTENNATILVGRVDLEINRRFLLELKVSPPTASNLRKDKKQLNRYISSYKKNGINLEHAALVYFGNFEVRIIEMSVHENHPRMIPY